MKPSKALLESLMIPIDRFLRKIKKDEKTEFIQMARKHTFSYYNEFRSLRIGLPRRNGNTTLAIKVLEKYLGALYITSTIDMVKDFNQRTKDKFKNRAFSLGRYEYHRGKRYRAKPLIVITDNTSQHEKSVMSLLYMVLNTYNPVYINLGT